MKDDNLSQQEGVAGVDEDIRRTTPANIFLESIFFSLRPCKGGGATHKQDGDYCAPLLPIKPVKKPDNMARRATITIMAMPIIDTTLL